MIVAVLKIVRNFGPIPFKARLSISLLLAVLLVASTALGAPKKKRLKMTKARSFRSAPIAFESFSLGDSINEILSSSADTGLHDSLSMIQLRDLKERAQPWWDEEDGADEEETRRVAQKAIAIQSSTSFLTLLRRSDLRNTYKDITRGFKSLTDTFRYSVQDTGDGLILSNDRKGEEIMEFNLKFSLSRGADPQVYLGDSVRLRYDWAEQHTMLEFGMDF